jgi:CRISPR-associated protein Cas1
MPINLQELPRMRDSLSYHYIEHAVVDRSQNSIETIQESGRTQVPAAWLSLIILGPGTSITQAAMKVLMENGCSVLWAGEDGMRCYAYGLGETRRSYHLIRQAELVSNPRTREEVVRKMYKMRFTTELQDGLSLAQIRGMEGVRVRETYAKASHHYGVPWAGRWFDRNQWMTSDPINQALSAANSLLNGICQTAITTGGYSTGLGFVHTGRMLSFVYDIADLYKTEITIPAAFETIAEGKDRIEARVRERCRRFFVELKLLERILRDIDQLLGIPETIEEAYQLDPPSELWKELFQNDSNDF